MTRTSEACLVILSIALLSACDSHENPGDLQLKLPKNLREISGLSALDDGTLLAIADEKAQIYRIDTAAQDVSKYGAMGDPVGKGDFEGIDVLNEFIYLTTSQGSLWRQRKGAPDTRYEVITTDAEDWCEIEGLAAWHEENSLLLLCKTVFTPADKNALIVLIWSAQEPHAKLRPLIMKPYTELGVKKLHPSGIAFSADRQNLFIVAAREKKFLEVSLEGRKVRHGKLPKKAGHRQTEGVAITSKNKLYLADEGGKGRGTLTEYVSNL